MLVRLSSRRHPSHVCTTVGLVRLIFKNRWEKSIMISPRYSQNFLTQFISRVEHVFYEFYATLLLNVRRDLQFSNNIRSISGTVCDSTKPTVGYSNRHQHTTGSVVQGKCDTCQQAKFGYPNDARQHTNPAGILSSDFSNRRTVILRISDLICCSLFFTRKVVETGSDDSFSDEESPKKRRDILTRRPSYRKILNDLGGGEIAGNYTLLSLLFIIIVYFLFNYLYYVRPRVLYAQRLHGSVFGSLKLLTNTKPLKNNWQEPTKPIKYVDSLHSSVFLCDTFDSDWITSSTMLENHTYLNLR